MAKGNCSGCGDLLTEQNARLSVAKRRKGHCKVCHASETARRRKENPGRYKKSEAKYKASIGGRYSHLKSQARHFGRDIEISFEEYCALILPNICSYCSHALSKFGYALDRRDHIQGYTLENCVPCCGQCNRWKGRLEGLGFSQERSIELLKELIEIRRIVK